MNDIAEERPDFFEGEYLGADDLNQLVVYLRDQSARHALGGHAWGIAAGLDLIEQPSPSGTGIDVYLLPGYAIDGYGRAVVVVNPIRLTVDRFSGQPAGDVQVWLYYVEGANKNVRPGFQVCNASDTFSRIGESYDWDVGNQLPLAQRQSGISVGGETVDDARAAARVFDSNGRIACDASVPYQDLPLADGTRRWYIPLGLVNWKPGTPGSFVALSEAERTQSRQLRRYLGVVAESVLAADGLIRLRRRDLPFDAAKSVDDQCSVDDLANPVHNGDLAVCDGRPEFKELVWVEGRMRVTGDTRILGGRLEFRDANGTDYGTQFVPGSPALLFDRKDDGNHADLRLLVGSAQSTDKRRNNFIIAAAGAPGTPPDKCGGYPFSPTTRVTVQDDGKVGIGPNPPDQILTVQSSPDSVTSDVFVHVAGASGGNDLYLGATGDGSIIAASKDLRVRTGNGANPGGGPDPTKDTTTHLFVRGDGKIGVGTVDPDSASLVTLEAPSTTYLLARAVTGPHAARFGADGDGATVGAMQATDDLRLGAGGADKVWVKPDGKIGIGARVPDRNVTVQGGDAAWINMRTSGGTEALIGADWTGTMVSAMSNHDLQLRAGGNVNRMRIQAGGNVGIGTDTPAAKLDVRGDIRLGANGELAALASLDFLRVVAGNVDGGGGISAGSGFTCDHPSQGRYVIKLATAFLAAPVVVATVTASADDDTASLLNVTASTFEIHVYDSSLKHREDNPFSFVAFGLRAPL